jgi:hypothetical protein
MLQRIRAILGYTWAVAALFVVLATFFGMNSWANLFVATTGLRISPWFTGGEVQQTVEHGTYQTLIHQPVFDSLIGERDEGFAQVTWRPAEGHKLPDQIVDTVDVSGDGKPDFELTLDNRADAVTLKALQPWVLSAGEVLKPHDQRAVRIALQNFH